MKINEKIKMLRKEKGLTQKEFANIINISEMSVRRYESGDRQPNIKTLTKIAKVLNVNTNFFLEEVTKDDLIYYDKKYPNMKHEVDLSSSIVLLLNEIEYDTENLTIEEYKRIQNATIDFLKLYMKHFK